MTTNVELGAGGLGAAWLAAQETILSIGSKSMMVVEPDAPGTLVAQRQNEDMKKISGWAAVLFARCSTEQPVPLCAGSRRF